MPICALGDAALNLPDNLTEISEEAFSECNSISIAHIPNSVRSILSKAFWGCENLSEVTILENVEYIAEDAFGECPNLKLKVFKDTYAFRYAASNKIPYSLIEEEQYLNDAYRYSLINSSEAKIIKYVGSETGTLIVPDHFDGYKVTRIGNEAFTSECKADVIVLPNTITEIESSAFYYCGFRSINIPDSVKTIGGVAFLGCSGFESIYIPASVESIECNPFRGCRGLKSITISSDNPNYTIYKYGLIRKDEMRLISYPYGLIDDTFAIPDGITIIDDYAFGYESPSCNKMIIPDTVETIGDGALCFSHAITIEIGSGVKEMGYGAFDYAHSIKTVFIAEGTTCIGDSAFYNCEKLETIYIPDSVTSIGNNAFTNDYKVIIIADPDSYAMIYAAENGITNRQIFEDFIYETEETGISIVKYIGAETGILIIPSHIEGKPVIRLKQESFTSECKSKTIVLPETLITIDSSAFYYCGFEKINIPNSVLTIGGVAFLGCSGFETITIPSSVTTIECNPFRGCRSLKSIIVDDNNPNYRIYKDGLVRKDEMRLISYPYGLINGTFTIPDGITVIDDYAFGYESPLCEKMIIPNSVEKIGAGSLCFSHATTIEIGNNVKEMGYGAFDYAHSLVTVVISDGTTCIGNSAFYNCEKLEQIYIPDSVVSIGTNAFEKSYKTTIIANPDSYAAQYAAENGITFEDK